MSFRYINPGYSALINSLANPTEATDTTLTQTGVGYYCCSSSYGITLPDVNSNTTDLWIKFYAYLPSDGSEIRVLLPGVSAGLYVSAGSGGHTIGYYRGSSLYHSFTGKEIISGAINPIWVHFAYGNLIEAKINDLNYSYNQYMVTYESFYPKDVRIYSNSANVVFSGIIISDEELSPKEQIVFLPVSATETAMTSDGNGLYTANATGQTLLQNVTVNSLISEFGSDSKVTGIALVGNPAYRTGTVLSSFTAITKQNNIITEHGAISLSDNTDTVIWNAFSTASDTTIADFQNIQLGWRAGE